MLSTSSPSSQNAGQVMAGSRSRLVLLADLALLQSDGRAPTMVARHVTSFVPAPTGRAAAMRVRPVVALVNLAKSGASIPFSAFPSQSTAASTSFHAFVRVTRKSYRFEARSCGAATVDEDGVLPVELQAAPTIATEASATAIPSRRIGRRMTPPPDGAAALQRRLVGAEGIRAGHERPGLNVPVLQPTSALRCLRSGRRALSGSHGRSRAEGRRGDGPVGPEAGLRGSGPGSTPRRALPALPCPRAHPHDGVGGLRTRTASPTPPRPRSPEPARAEV